MPNARPALLSVLSPHCIPTHILTTHKHAPGTKVGNDAVPEFHAQTVPTGTAPKDRVFASQAEDAVEEGDKTKAADTITGADSAEVNAGILK